MEIRDNAVIRPPQGPLDPDNLPFGRTFAPNMFIMDWEDGRGWFEPRIVPYGPISLAPAAMVFHYGQEIFEGLKGFRHADGSVHLFRPDRNAARLNRSARRMSMPEVPVDLQLEAMRLLVRRDSDWVPPAPGS
jgi:branched-chain amino acid aminotransferase